MYTIYADGKLLHAPHLFHEGCGVLSPKLVIELNKAGSLDFTIPPTNALYDSVTKLKSIVTVFQNGEELFRGRVLHDEKDFYKQKKTYCEGELAFLLDSTQRPYTFSGSAKKLFEQYIKNHNDRVDKEKQFKVGKVDDKFASEAAVDVIACENINYPTTMDELNNQILDVVNGYVKTRGSGDIRYIDLLELKDPDSKTENTTSQIIEFGINLLDISEYITAENVFTVLIPLGDTVDDENEETTDKKLTIASVNNGVDYLENTEAIKKFGRIEKIVEWSDVSDAKKLKEYGEKLLAKSMEMMVMTLTVNAIDLHILNVDNEAIHVGDIVRVISLPHGLNANFRCTKITYDLSNPDQNEYVFGVSFSSLTEQQLNDKKTIQSSVSTIISSANIINTVQKTINTLPNTYVTVEQYDKEKTEFLTNDDIDKMLGFNLVT